MHIPHICVKCTYMEDSGVFGSQRLPKNFMTPWVLLVLKQWSLHGYLILQQLERMGFSGVDHATLYRELRRLETRGLGRPRSGRLARAAQPGESIASPTRARKCCGPGRRSCRATSA